ncbi:MAG: hypothetical protein ABSB40_01555 [Nitrososphaeria archaeon]
MIVLKRNYQTHSSITPSKVWEQPEKVSVIDLPSPVPRVGVVYLARYFWRNLVKDKLN